MSYLEMSEKQIRNKIDANELNENQLKQLLLVKPIGNNNKLTLSEQFLRDYADKLNLGLIEITDALSDDFIITYKDKLDFSKYQRSYTSKELFEEIKDKIDLNSYLSALPLDMEFIEEQFDVLKSYKELYEHQNLPLDFIEKHIEDISDDDFETWTFSDGFEYNDDFLKKYIKKLNWSAVTKRITEDKNLNIDDIIIAYQDYLDWKIIADNSDSISQETKNEFNEILQYGKNNYNRDQLLAIKQIIDYNHQHEIKIDIDNFINKMVADGPMADYNKLVQNEKDNIESESRASEEELTDEADNSQIPTYTNEKIEHDKISQEELSNSNLTKEQIEMASETQSLSMPFMTKFRNFIDWTKATANQRFTERFANMHEDLIDWDQMSIQKMSAKFYNEHKNKLDLDTVLLNNIFTPKDLQSIDWLSESEKVTDYRNIEKYQSYILLDKIDWSKVDIENKMYPEFFLDNIGEINIKDLSKLTNLSLLFVDKLSESQYFVDRFNYTEYFENNNLDIDYLVKYQDEIDWFELSSSPKLTDEIINTFGDKLNWTRVIANPEVNGILYYNDHEDEIKEILDKKELFENSDKSSFSQEQIDKINEGFDNGLDANVYADPKFSVEQMNQIYMALAENIDTTIIANPDFSVEQMKSLIYSKTHDADISNIKPSFSLERIKEEYDISKNETGHTKEKKFITKIDKDLNTDGKYRQLYEDGYSFAQIRAIANIEKENINIGDINTKDYTGVQLNLIASSLKYNEAHKDTPELQIDINTLTKSGFNSLEMELYAKAIEQKNISELSYGIKSNYEISADEIKAMPYNKKKALVNAIENKVNIEKFITKNANAKYIDNEVYRILTNREKINNIKNKIVNLAKKIIDPIIKTLKDINETELSINNANEQNKNEETQKNEIPQQEKKHDVTQEEIAKNVNEILKEEQSQPDNTQENSNNEIDSLKEELTDNIDSTKVVNKQTDNLKGLVKEDKIITETKEAISLISSTIISNEDFNKMFKDGTLAERLKNDITNANKALDIIKGNEELSDTTNIKSLEDLIAEKQEQINIINSLSKEKDDIENNTPEYDMDNNNIENAETTKPIVQTENEIDNEVKENKIIVPEKLKELGITDIEIEDDKFVITNGTDQMVLANNGIERSEFTNENNLENLVKDYLYKETLETTSGETIDNKIRPLNMNEITQKVSELTGMETPSVNISEKTGKLFINGKKDGQNVYASVDLDKEKVRFENKFFENLNEKQKRQSYHILKNNIEGIKLYKRSFDTKDRNKQEQITKPEQSNIENDQINKPNEKPTEGIDTLKEQKLDNKILSAISNIVMQSDQRVSNGYFELLEEIGAKCNAQNKNPIFDLKNTSVKITDNKLLSISGTDNKNQKCEINVDLTSNDIVNIKVNNKTFDPVDKSVSNLMQNAKHLINYLNVQQYKVGMAKAFIDEKKILKTLIANSNDIDISKLNIITQAKSTQEIVDKKGNYIKNTLKDAALFIFGYFDKKNPEQAQVIKISNNGNVEYAYKDTIKCTINISSELEKKLKDIVLQQDVFDGYKHAIESGHLTFSTQEEIEARHRQDLIDYPEWAEYSKTKKEKEAEITPINKSDNKDQHQNINKLDNNLKHNEASIKIPDGMTQENWQLVMKDYMSTVDKWKTESEFKAESLIEQISNEYYKETGNKITKNELQRIFDEKKENEINDKLYMDNGNSLIYECEIIPIKNNNEITYHVDSSIKQQIKGTENSSTLYGELTYESRGKYTTEITTGSMNEVYKAYAIGELNLDNDITQKSPSIDKDLVPINNEFTH